MTSNNVKVSESLCFNIRTKSLKKANEAHLKYNLEEKNSASWLKEDNKMPIFIDTNVFLNIYDISSTERDSFIKFLQKNKDRIYVSSQVQREYLRHRVLQIRGVKSRITKLKNEILTAVSGLDKLIDNKLDGIKGVAYRSVVKYGMPQTATILNEIMSKLSDEACKKTMTDAHSLSQTLTEKLNLECKEFDNICAYERNDALMAAIASVNILEPLDDNEKKVVIDTYKNCRAKFDCKSNDMASATITFPGSGDKDKPIEASEEESVAWGDLYIYCDMLKFMKQHNTNVLFITRDVAKGDWLSRDKHEPFVHYIENAYEQTGYLMFIKESDNYLPLATENNPVSKEPSGIKDDDFIVSAIDADCITPISKEEVETSSKESNSDIIEYPDVAFQTVSIPRKFKLITKDSFMDELRICSDWAHSYGAGYVNKNYFIFDILGQKKYDFASCLSTLDQLKKEHLLEVKHEKHGDRDFECISICRKDDDF